ncbi:S-adenosyl-L-methionine-dependent methyltransferase [Sordaria brevicollis]|uniref:S-adenosyl-L-methionine-dependent methyltransferase n=1 Tax=Sordaria brevicollis TaxID=83679 RepID=A0AAE0PFE9_SORBR|nr:S-adenosyl-L-methionine-dependent methyltransferase [Sordaria brevicollis]
MAPSVQEIYHDTVDNTTPNVKASPSSSFDPNDISINARPCDLGRVSSLIDDIASYNWGDIDFSKDRNARISLLSKARSLVAALETPRETLIRHIGAETSNFYTIVIGIETNLFHEMAKDNGSPKTVTHLASAISFDPDLLRRMLRHLAAMNHIIQTGSDEYRPNNFSKALTTSPIAGSYQFYRDICLPAMSNLHKWLKTKSYQSPQTIIDNPFTFGHQTSQTFFEVIASSEKNNQHFNNHMVAYCQGQPAWCSPEVYPAFDRLITGFDPTPSSSSDGSEEEATLLVDIGGNVGHDLLTFSSCYPSHPGRLVLQDLPSVLSSAPPSLSSPSPTSSPRPIELHPHNFFTPQPILSARAYYLHHILHDWPDSKCLSILSYIKRAMKPGYSRLLINESIIPERKAGWEATYLDLYMMVLFGARERTEREWRVLLEDGAGLKVVGVYGGPGGGVEGVEGVLECEVALEDEEEQ